MRRSTLDTMSRISNRCFILMFAPMIFGFIRLYANDYGDTDDVMEVIVILWPFILALALMLLGFVLSITPVIAGGLKNMSIRAKGKDARAKVLSVKDSGIMINDQPVLNFKLVVYPEDRPVFSAETSSTFSILDIHKYQEGSFLRVKYNPQDNETAVMGPE